MSFLDQIFGILANSDDKIVLRELREPAAEVTGPQLLEQVLIARSYLRRLRLKKGDRCALLGHNSIPWVALDLAMMAEGLTVVPLYARQAPAELVAMMKDCWPSVLACGDQSLADAIVAAWPDAPPHFCFDKVFTPERAALGDATVSLADDDVVTIIYTSGTSGEAKGVMLTAANVGFMLQRTTDRLDALMKASPGQDRVFHYLPFSAAAAWIALLTFLRRSSLVLLNTDLTKLPVQMPVAQADYFLNVPALLDRTRRAVDEQLGRTGGFALKAYNNAKAAWMRRHDGKSRAGDGLWLAVANRIVFPKIRRRVLGRRIRALISGSAPLNLETQLYFEMLGVPILQVYGLTETTAICTMDDPNGRVVPGRAGPAISGIEMKVDENSEIVVRGPNIFPGYWNRPQETATVLRDGWFHTGDQGEVDEEGNWKITGRIKNLIVLGSGHNVAPEPIEEKIAQKIPGAGQVVVLGNARGYLAALITGMVSDEKVQSVLDAVNATLPHYKQVRAFHQVGDPFTIESGLLTANGKLKRDAIAQRFQSEIDVMYRTAKTA